VLKEGDVMSQPTEQIVRTFALVVAAGITLDVAEPASLEQTLRDCAQNAAFIESVRLRAIARLDQHVTVDTNQTIINTSRGSKRQAQTAQKRANATAKMPALADALENGSIAADHVDAVAQTLSTHGTRRPREARGRTGLDRSNSCSHHARTVGENTAAKSSRTFYR
jgi:hypothetical protein